MSHHYMHFENVHYSYPDGYKALDGITFTISHGEHVALLGLNGAGKSTLLLHTNGLLLPSSGTVDIGGTPVTCKTAPDIRRTVGMVFQNPDDMLFMPTIADDVAFGPRNMNLPPDEVRRRVDDALFAVGATDLADKTAFQLSGGQRRAVAIASVLSMNPDILVMDEPSANLDSTARRQLINIIANFAHTVLLATHDLAMALEICPRAIIMAHGRIVADGPTDRLLADTDLMAQTGLEPPFIVKQTLGGVGCSR